MKTPKKLVLEACRILKACDRSILALTLRGPKLIYQTATSHKLDSPNEERIWLEWLADRLRIEETIVPPRLAKKDRCMCDSDFCFAACDSTRIAYYYPYSVLLDGCRLLVERRDRQAKKAKRALGLKPAA